MRVRTRVAQPMAISGSGDHDAPAERFAAMVTDPPYGVSQDDVTRERAGTVPLRLRLHRRGRPFSSTAMRSAKTELAEATRSVAWY